MKKVLFSIKSQAVSSSSSSTLHRVAGSVLKAPQLSKYGIFYREVSLKVSHIFVIVYDQDWPALKNQNIIEFLIKQIRKKKFRPFYLVTYMTYFRFNALH